MRDGFRCKQPDNRQDLSSAIDQWRAMVRRQTGAAVVVDPFFSSAAWLDLRYRVLKKHNGACNCCGNLATPGNPLQVDHIKPRSIFPALALEINNLQVLCRNCNMGKSNKDFTDWRRAELPEVEVLNAADREKLARLQQLAWLKKNGDNKQIRMEAWKEYRALWRSIDMGLINR